MNKSPRIKKKIKTVFRIIIIGVMVVFAFMAYFFISNEAPILDGEVDYGVPYNSSQTLDVYRPVGHQPDFSPVIIYIHGGAWIVGQKESINMNRFNRAVKSLREQGYTVIAPSYTLAKKDLPPFPQSIIDIYEVLEWIKSHAEDYRLDPDHIGVLGESAGAHLALMVAFTRPSDFGLNYEKAPLRYVVDIYGPSQLKSLYHTQINDSIKSLLYKLPESFRGQLDISELIFGVDPKKDSVRANAIMRKYSPIYYLDTADPPTLIIHGDGDLIVPIDQSYLLKAELDSLGIMSEFHALSGGVNHSFFGATDAQKDSVQQWVVSFIMQFKPFEERKPIY